MNRSIEAPHGSVEVRTPVSDLRASPTGAKALETLTEQAIGKAGVSRTLTGRYGYERDGSDYLFTFPMTADPNAEPTPPLVLTDGE